MSMPSRTILGLGAISLALVATGALLVNWRTVFENVIAAWDTQAEKTQVTLFRWGELMSISAELKDQFGAEPNVTYDTSTKDRTLDIRFVDYQLPEQATIEEHAREIAVFAIAKTKKSKQIDAVRVIFGVESADGSRSYTFALADLMPSPARPAT